MGYLPMQPSNLFRNGCAEYYHVDTTNRTCIPAASPGGKAKVDALL